MHGATGILYSKKLAPCPEAWADMWSGAQARRITMLDDPAEVFAAALKRLGASVNAADDGNLQAARNLAIAQKPLLRAYLNEEVRDQVIAGDVLAAQMWTQVAQMAIDAASGLAFAFPREGFPLYVDCACILRESRHVELAYEFLNYLLEPRVAAQIAAEITGATVNAEARKLLPARLQESRVLFPDEETRTLGELFRALPAHAQRLRDRYWTEIKSA
jgi:spermidine/putrescine transport system substrate-binding protein